MEPPGDPGPSPTQVKTGLILNGVHDCESGAGLRERRALCCLVHARVHAEPSPIRSPAMISRPPKAAVGWTRRMLLLALSVVLLGTARAAGTSASSCSLDKVLITNGDSILVNVRALGHCHNDEAVAHILKTASAKRSHGHPSMFSHLTQSRNCGAYERSCHRGILQSIRERETREREK